MLFLIPVGGFALGLGNLELKSALNQPFEGEIQLLSATAEELDSLAIGLAESRGISPCRHRPPIHSQSATFSA